MTRYYADKILPGGRRKPIKPGGRRYFGPKTLAWVRRRAKKRHDRIVVGTIENKRDKIVAWLRWGISNEPSIHYQQSRPIPLKAGAAKKLPLYLDCSSSTTIAWYQAGAPDPNGRNYDGSGYTGTMLAHLKHIPKEQAKRGDLVVYGASPGRHVCAFLEDWKGPSTLLFSHGQEKGPFAITYAAEAAAQSGYAPSCLTCKALDE